MARSAPVVQNESAPDGDVVDLPTKRRRKKGVEENRRPDIERFLEERGIRFEYVSGVRPVRFDLERSMRNQARLGHPINKGTARQYAEAIGNGDTFPPVLAHDEGGKLIVLDGNHRLISHVEAGESLDVYICHGSPQQLALVAFEANAHHGLPSSEEDRVHHALWLIDNGINQAEAAQRLSVPRAVLRRAVAGHTADRRADEVGILRREWEAVGASQRQRLANISTDEGFEAAVRLAREAALATDEVFEMVAKLNESGRSGSRQAAIVAAMRNAMKERIDEVRLTGGARKGKRLSSPRARLALSLGQVAALPAATAFKALPDVERHDISQRVDDAIAQLQAIRKALA